MATQQFSILSPQSSIEWIGRKVTGSHNGTIDVQSGNIVVTDGKISAGNIIIDTTSIRVLDVTDPETNDNFRQHLASDDFFSAGKFPTATFEITDTSVSGDNYKIDGNLTIKGITEPLTFEATVTSENNTLAATGKATINRTRYNMKFRSGNFFQNLGDTLIYDHVDLLLHVKAIVE